MSPKKRPAKKTKKPARAKKPASKKKPARKKKPAARNRQAVTASVLKRRLGRKSPAVSLEDKLGHWQEVDNGPVDLFEDDEFTDIGGSE